MLEVIAALLLSVHLLLVDVAMIGPLASAWFDWRGTRQNDPALVAFGRKLALASLAALVAGSLLGGLLLALRYHGDRATGPPCCRYRAIGCGSPAPSCSLPSVV